MKLRAQKETLAPAVWPSAAVQSWYYHALRAPLEEMTTELLAGLRQDWEVGFNPVGMAQDAPNLVVLLRKRLDKFAEKWTKRWGGMEAHIAQQFATRAWTATDNGVRASFAKAGFTIKFKPTKPMLMAYNVRVAANVGLIRTIPQQYLKDVTTQVWNAVTTGSDMHALERSIQKVYGVADRRAAFIARDQNNKAKASFEATRRMELGIEEGEWQHSGAGKEKRPTHVAAGRKRKRFSLKQGWLDPATGKYIWPGTEIGCRCTSCAVIPGLD